MVLLNVRLTARKLCLFSLMALSLAMNSPAIHGQDAGHDSEPGGKQDSGQSGTLSFGGSLRFRFESCQNFNIKDYGRGGDSFLLERVRLHADFHMQRGPRFFAELQDARVWGTKFDVEDFSGNSPYENPLDLRQLYLQWDRVAGTPWGVKVGRQEIHFGDNRIFGPGDWGNVGSYLWDAAMVYYDTRPLRADVFFGRRVRYESAAWSLDVRHYNFDMAGMYITLKSLPVVVDVFAVARIGQSTRLCGSQATEKEKRFTAGVSLDGHIGDRVDYGGLVACQGGRWGEEIIRAFAVHARLGYAFHDPWQMRLIAELTYGSGDRQAQDGICGTWDGVFGSRDKLYGRMNLMAWSNLQDYQLSFQAKPTAKTVCRLDYHFFSLASCRDCWYYSPSKALRQEPTGASGSRLGQEIDLIFEWRPAKSWSLLMLGSHFSPEVFIERTGPAGTAIWAAMQVNYEF